MELKKTENIFQFVTQAGLVELTGFKARDVMDLLNYLRTASDAVVYHHTHHFLKQHQFLSPEPPNDFAFWVTHVLNEAKLGEQLAAIDTVQFSSISELRDAIVAVLEAFVATEKNFRRSSDGEQFYFMKSKSFILPTHHGASNLAEFHECLSKISANSLYHHMFEARLRIGKPTNDFSFWLESELGEKDLARSIKKLDPYTHTLEGLRERILRLVKRRLDTIQQEASHVS